MNKTVLFICTHNSARSQMAEGLANHMLGPAVRAYSAGTNPSQLNPGAVAAMSEMGIDISGQFAKNLSEFTDRKFDIVVTLCDSAAESCPFFPGNIVLHVPFPDPAAEPPERQPRVFRSVRDSIKKWIGSKLAELVTE